MRDAIESSPFLIVRTNDMPWGMLGIGSLEHGISGAGVFVPATEGFKVHRAKLPLPEGVPDARLEAPLLFFFPNFRPVFNENNSGINDVLLCYGTELKESPMLLRGAKPHDLRP